MSLPALTFLTFGLVAALTCQHAAAAPAAPSGFVALARSASEAVLTWVDNADDEDEFYVEYKSPGSSQWLDIPAIWANFEVARIQLGLPENESEFDFRIAAVKDSDESAWVETSVVLPETDVALGDTQGLGLVEGEAFNFQIPVSGGTHDGFLAEDLPAGVSLDAVSGIISGTAPVAGVYRIFYGVDIDTPNGPRQLKQVLFLRVQHSESAPVVADPAFSVPPLAQGSSGEFDLSALFADPKRPAGALFRTSLGDFTVALHPEATPNTAANFLGYVGNGAYDGSILHRSEAGTLVEGGKFARSPGGLPSQWTRLAANPPAPNEAGISNERGTLTMAKEPFEIDSATTPWFLNTGDNSATFDALYGGFTAFGRVVGAEGLSVVDQINALLTGTYDISVNGGAPSAREDIPVLDDPVLPSLSETSLVRIESIREVPPLVLEVIDNSAPGVATVALDGMDLAVSANAVGTAGILLRATNLDGNTVEFSLFLRIADVTRPSVRLTAPKRRLPADTKRALVRGVATDDAALASWRVRLNRDAWRRGGNLQGTRAVFRRRIARIQPGRNVIRVQVFDLAGNRSANAVRRTRVR